MRSRVMLRAPLAVAAVLSLTAAACGDGAAPESEEGASESDLAASTTLDLGPITLGETKTVEYTPAPRNRAFTFTAKKGDVVELDVRSTDGGDAVAYILRPDRSTLVRNDDASPATKDAFVRATVPQDGTYFVAFSELKRKKTRFQVTFRGTGIAVGLGWNGDLMQEELRRFEPSTMKSSLVSVIPGVTWARGGMTVFDPKTRRVHFVGGDATASAGWLHGVDLATGAVVSRAPWPAVLWSDAQQKLVGFDITAMHAMNDGTAYAVGWNGDLDREEVRRVDLSTMNMTFVATLPGIRYTDGSFADPVRGRIYVRVGDGASPTKRLYTIEAATGAVLASPVVPRFEWLSAEGRFDGIDLATTVDFLADGTAVSVAWNGAASRAELRTLEPSTMATTLKAALPDMSTRFGLSHFADRKRDIVYVTGVDGSDGENLMKLFGIDAKTGAIVSKAPVPQPVWDAARGDWVGLRFDIASFASIE